MPATTDAVDSRPARTRALSALGPPREVRVALCSGGLPSGTGCFSAVVTPPRRTRGPQRLRSYGPHGTRLHNRQRPLRRGVVDLDLVIAARERKVNALGMARIDNGDASTGDLEPVLRPEVGESLECITERVCGDNQVCRLPRSDLCARGQVADEDLARARSRELVQISGLRACPVDWLRNRCGESPQSLADNPTGAMGFAVTVAVADGAAEVVADDEPESRCETIAQAPTPAAAATASTAPTLKRDRRGALCASGASGCGSCSPHGSGHGRDLARGNELTGVRERRIEDFDLVIRPGIGDVHALGETRVDRRRCRRL